jgi:quercetin dioxygenase-like cupin family protein
MSHAPTHTLGSPGIDRFSPAQLLRTARLFASDPELPSLVDHHCGERRWVELDSSPYLQIWLHSWPAGTETGWHDHDESAGAFLTVSGILSEQTNHEDGRMEKTFIGGEGRPFAPGHAHNLSNVGHDTALSVHLFTPRRTRTPRYAGTPQGPQAKGLGRPLE